MKAEMESIIHSCIIPTYNFIHVEYVSIKCFVHKYCTFLNIMAVRIVFKSVYKLVDTIAN